MAGASAFREGQQRRDAVTAHAVVKALVSQALPHPSSTRRLLWCLKWEKGSALVSALQLLEWPNCTCSLGSVEVDGLRPHPPLIAQMERWHLHKRDESEPGFILTQAYMLPTECIG